MNASNASLPLPAPLHPLSVDGGNTTSVPVPLPPAPPPADALCLIGFLVCAFVPFSYVANAVERDELASLPRWLLAAYAATGAAYGWCVFGGGAVDGPAHAYGYALASAFAARHSFQRAAEAVGDDMPAASTAVFAVAAAGAAQAAVAWARGNLINCGGVFLACASFIALAGARVASRWRADPVIDRQVIVARRRAMAVLAAAALSAAAQPLAGACGGRGGGGWAAVFDALTLFPASEAVC